MTVLPLPVALQDGICWVLGESAGAFLVIAFIRLTSTGVRP